MTVTAAVTLLVMSGLMTAYLTGLHMFAFSRPKLTASDNARKTIGRIIGDLRSADHIRIGQGDLSSFTEVAEGGSQQGNAIQVFPGTNSAEFTLYYWDAADKTLKRATNGASGADVMATSVSNQVVFTSEDYAGNVTTNNAGNRVIGMTLQFSQIEYPIVKIGPDSYYDFYQVRTKVTKRKLPQP